MPMEMARLNISWHQELKIRVKGGEMKVEHTIDGVKRIEIGVGERVSIHGYKKGEKPSGENEIASFSMPMEVEIKMVRGEK